MAQPVGVSSGPAVLVVDIGGTHVKLHATGHETVALDSGPGLTPADVVAGIGRVAADWRFDVVSIGYPGVVVNGRPAVDPHNLGPGWVGFDFALALGRPVRLINDAALQALGSYQGGRMLFLGLGTGLGSALVIDGVVVPLELAHLPYRKGRTYEDYLGKRGLERWGPLRWRKRVVDVVRRFEAAFLTDEVVIGGGNAKRLKRLPPRVRLGDNENAVLGGLRLWTAPGDLAQPARAPEDIPRPDPDPALEAAADRALELVQDGMRLGLGSGRAAATFIVRLGARVAEGLRIRAVPTSPDSARLARAVGIPLIELDDTPLDLTVDGADEVGPGLDLIKGRGGALVRERIVAAASRRQVIVVGSDKLVTRLGQRASIPLEIVPLALGPVTAALRSLGLESRVRRDREGRALGSDNGGLTLDCPLPAPLRDGAAARELATRLRAIPGVVDTGLFLGTAARVIVGYPDGRVEVLDR